MSAETDKASLESTTTHLPDHIKLALTYAEESSRRTRWTIFIIQLAAVLVLASVWKEANFNWLMLRLKAAQLGVHYLECEQESRYLHPISPDAPFNSINTLANEISQSDKNGFMPLSREEVDIAYSCTANPLTPEDKTKAQGYLKDWNYSLPQARKNVADLQQMIGNHVMGVGVPILGIVFDINDLSIVAGITFSILLSWFYYNLRRQDKNTNHLFEMAESSKVKVDGKSMLETIYYLLRMTQVLTIPPAANRTAATLRLCAALRGCRI